MSKRLITRKGRGRNSITQVHREGLKLIEAMAAEGQDQRSIAKALGLARKTLTDLRDRDEAVAEAWDRGHAALADEITHHLLGAARKGNITAAIFLAKARLGWREGHAAEGQALQVNQQFNINLPEPADRDEYIRRITGQANTERNSQ